MYELDSTWNCQSGRLYDPEYEFPWEDDDGDQT